MQRQRGVPIAADRAGSTAADSATLASGAGLALVGRVSGRVLQVLTEIFLARVLGPAIFGLYAAGWTLLRIIGLIAPLGADKGAQRFGTGFLGKDPGRLRMVIVRTLGTSLLSGGVLGVVVWLTAGQIGETLGKPGLASVLRGMAPAVALISALRVAAAITRISKRMLHSVLSEELLRPGLNFALVGVAWLAGWGLSGAVAACSISFAAAFLLALFQIRGLFPAAFAQGVKVAPVPGLVPFSLSVSITGTAILLLGWIDRLLLTGLRSSAEVGIYQATTQTAFVFSTILISFNAILVPMISELHETGERDRMAELYRISTKWGLYVGTPIFLTIAVAPKALVSSILGPEYLPGVVPMLLLSGAQLINAGTGAVGPLLIMTGHERRWLFFPIGALVVDVVLGLWWIPKWGIVGAAAATACAISGLFLIGVWQVHRVHDMVPYDRRYLKGVVATGVAAAAGWAVGLWQSGEGWSELLWKGVTVTAVFGAVLFIAGFDEEDRVFLRVLQRQALRWRSR